MVLNLSQNPDEWYIFWGREYIFDSFWSHDQDVKTWPTVKNVISTMNL